MIVDTMTLKEINDEIIKDMKESQIENTVGCKILERIGKYWSLVIKRTTKYSFWAFEPFKVKSARGNEFYVLPYTHGKRSFRQEGVLYVIAVFFNGGVAMIVGEHRTNPQCLFFRPHFFERYWQRFQDGQHASDDKKGALNILAQNHAIQFKKYDHNKHHNSVICEMEDGVAFGTVKDGFIVINTYISKGMLKGEQTDIVDDLNERRTEYERQDLESYLGMKRGMLRRAIPA